MQNSLLGIDFADKNFEGKGLSSEENWDLNIFTYKEKIFIVDVNVNGADLEQNLISRK